MTLQTTRPTFNLTLTVPAAQIEATDTASRTLRGVAIPYGEDGATSAGVLTIDAGAVRVPANLRAVKLFLEHGRLTPTGYATEATDAADALRMAFRVAATPDGDQALLEAAEGVRDGLSVELTNVTVQAGHVTGADLVGVAQVAIPAFAGAVLTAALDDDQQAQVNDLAGQISQITAPDDTDEEEPDGEEPTEEEEGAMTDTTLEGSAPIGTGVVGMTPPPARRRDPAAARRLFAAQAAEALRGASDAAQVNAALADIHPGNAGTEDVFPRPAWLGELWSPEAPNRAIVNAIGVESLTAMKMQGWKWQTKPEVAPYAGNKAEIPTSPAVIVPAEAEAHRIAGGWDLDRIYVDFNTGFVDAFLRAAVQDYRKKSQTYFIDGHAAIVGPPAVPAAEGFLDDATVLPAAADLVGAISAIAAFLTGNGASISFLVMAPDLFSDFLGLKATDVPWWLQNQGSVNLTGSASVAGITVGVDPGLAAGTVAGGDRDAIELWETGPINVQAINLPNGGIDLALFGYWAQQVHDPAGLATCSVAVTP